MNQELRLKLLFIIPSAIGILLFMVPILVHDTWTIAVKLLADIINGAVGTHLPFLCCIILTVSSVLAFLALFKPHFIMKNAILKECFRCTPVWVVIRILGCVFVWLTYFHAGEGGGKNGILTAISGEGQGGVALDLISGLVIIFAIASFLLPLLLDFGLLEFIGALLTKYMRPVFQVPGRAAVDCITSWIGDGTLGVMLTCNQYEGGYYSEKEAAIISTTFSAVSITFSLVVLNQVGLTQYFGVYYLLICFVGIVCAIICPRIPPLSLKKNYYLVPGRVMSEDIPKEYKNSREYGLALAMKRVSEHKGAGEFFYNGLKNCVGMWFAVLPTVMCIGTVALIVANYTPVFRILGMPFMPLLTLLRVPEATAASSTLMVGFADMFTPSVIIAASSAPDITRFIVAVISVTQVLFLDEVGGLILASKLPIHLLELFQIFLERTIISLLIVCPVAHLIFH
ncbi:MAG: YjiH family protein [Lachnospiraceae bacterium]|nr:YjiH family protein [Lachnospiraceae bacterium]